MLYNNATFEERLSGLKHDIFTSETVLVVGIGTHTHFYGFSIEKQLKPDIQKEAS